MSAELDGELGRGELGQLDRHVAACVACAEHRRLLARQHQRLRLRPADPVPDLSDAILARVALPASAPTRQRRRGRRRAVAAVVTGAVLVGSAGAAVAVRSGGALPPPQIRVVDARASAAPSGGVSAVYVHVANWGGGDRVTGASSEVAEHVSIHEMHAADGVVTMEHAPDLDVPGDGALVLSPGGAHVMLEGLRRPLEPGDTFTVVITFARAGEVAVPVEVLDVAQLARETGVG